MSNLLYDALMLGRNKKTELEEYAIAAGRKEAASFRVREESIHISNVISDGEFSVQILQEVPGYLEIEVFCNDSFLVFDRKVITTDDMEDGKFSFSFMVISDRLHNGRNETSLFFRTSCQNVELPVTIDNRIRVNISETNPRERIWNLEQEYILRKLGKTEQWQWMDGAMQLLGDIPGGDVTELYLLLYKAQVYITAGEDVHAKNHIEHVGTQIPKLETRDYDLYCYFVYLASLYEELPGTKNAMEPDALSADLSDGSFGPSGFSFSRGTDVMELSALQKVRWVFAHYPSWRALWILFYMDPSYQENASARLSALQDAFYQYECISPVMYAEALKIYLEKPEALSQMGQFELHVLRFGMKYEALSRELLLPAAQLLPSGMQYYTRPEKRIALKLFMYAYKKFGEEMLLKALLELLIALDLREQQYHAYFEKGLSFREPDGKILDYYIYTLDQNNLEQLPDAVIRHFLDHTELLYEYRKYMYANIITNKYHTPAFYQECLGNIVNFAEYQVMQGFNDDLLAVIYKEILEKDLLTVNMKSNLFDVICTREILCDNDRMQKVLVFHRELPVYQESPLRDGKAYVRVYSSDALILFMDTTGNIYHHISYKIRQLINTREYVDQCIKDAQISKYMLMGDTLPILRAYKSPVEILQYFTGRHFEGQFRQDYEQELLKNTVAYYVKNSREEQVYEELLKFLDYQLPSETRGRLIGILLKQGRIDEAFSRIREYGTCGMEAETVASLAHDYIERHGMEEDELLTMLCEEGYGANGFDELVFEYLYRYYDGRMELLAELFRACNAYQKPAEVIEERILRKTVETGEHPEVVSQVFRRYHESGEDRELMVRYLEFRSAVFLYETMKGSSMPEGFSDMEFFDLMEADMIRGESFPDDCAIAYLLYRMRMEVPTQRQKRNFEQCLKDLVRRGKMLEEFKYYRKYFELPSTLANNIIVSAFSEDPEDRPMISYEITGASGMRSGTEEMEEIFRHCYVKYFTLFYGEKVIFRMDGRNSSEIRYRDMEICHDGSRYAALDDLIRYLEEKDTPAFQQAAMAYREKELLTEILF